MTEGIQQQLTIEERGERVRQLAADRFRRQPDWVSFYREVLGVDGLIDEAFPIPGERAQFEQTEQFEEIQRMLAKLRERSRVLRKPDESTKVITVRLPESMHEALRHEAHSLQTSMNKLCISKLLQVIDGELVPPDLGRSKKRTAKPKHDGTPAANKNEPAVASEPQHAAQDTPPQPQPPIRQMLGGGRPF